GGRCEATLSRILNEVNSKTSWLGIARLERLVGKLCWVDVQLLGRSRLGHTGGVTRKAEYYVGLAQNRFCIGWLQNCERAPSVHQGIVEASRESGIGTQILHRPIHEYDATRTILELLDQ